MFPNIHTNDRSVSEEWILVGSGDNFKRLRRITVTLKMCKCTGITSQGL